MIKLETSLFARLLLRVMVVLAFGAAGLLTAAWYYAIAAADDAYDRLLQGAAIQISENLSVDDGALAIKMPSSAFELLGLASRDRVFYRVVDTRNRTLTGYEDLQPELDYSKARRTPVFLDGFYHGAKVRIAITGRAISDPSLTGWAYVIIAQTTEARQALASDLTANATLLVGLMGIATLVATALTLRLSLRPVSELATALSGRDPKDLTPLRVSVPRELEPFVLSINHFMSRLDGRIKLLQRFIGDSAHQIRTPLTALSAQISLIDETRLDGDDRRHLLRVKERASELSHLTNQLLTHAMVIHRFDSHKLLPLDLTDIARKAFKAAVPLTLDPEIVVSFEAPDNPVVVKGDGLSLREALVNVIDNSLRHGSVSRLEVRVRSSSSRAFVEVEDDGLGIPPELWQTVTARFGSHKSENQVSGLGFAIASEVSLMLQGELRFEQRSEHRGFTTIIDLPLHRASEP
ncbi:sensor histidine kinase [Neorhizobium sp. LjRoot104]|uniref:sensor histidine kinase n=1 Tax=Neorhizobium sp. LjRoot104 TaxID=3342254 RepID=UPI003ECF5110